MATAHDSTCVQVHYKLGHIHKLQLTCTMDSTDGSYDDFTLTEKFEGRLLDLITNPSGTTAPQDNYSITLKDQHGHDVLEGVGATRDTADTEKAPIVYAGTAIHPYVDDSDVLILDIIGNNVNSAITVIEIYYSLGGA